LGIPCHLVFQFQYSVVRFLRWRRWWWWRWKPLLLHCQFSIFLQFFNVIQGKQHGILPSFFLVVILRTLTDSAISRDYSSIQQSPQNSLSNLRHPHSSPEGLAGHHRIHHRAVGQGQDHERQGRLRACEESLVGIELIELYPRSHSGHRRSHDRRRERPRGTGHLFQDHRTASDWLASINPPDDRRMA
jgi:hypothetical protein